MIIELFLLNKNKVIPKTKISTSIWWDYSGIWVSDNTMNVTFFHLRKKIWDFFKLETVIWEGYILKE
jgi:DNA-binding response OmpR family regulator